MGFWPDEGVSPEVVAQVSAQVPGKVITALIVGAGEGSAIEVGRIKAKVFAADAGHYVTAKHFGEPPAIDRIEIVKDGTIRLNDAEIGGASAIDRTARAPRDIAAESNVFLYKDCAAETGIKAAA